MERKKGAAEAFTRLCPRRPRQEVFLKKFQVLLGRRALDRFEEESCSSYRCLSDTYSSVVLVDTSELLLQ